MNSMEVNSNYLLKLSWCQYLIIRVLPLNQTNLLKQTIGAYHKIRVIRWKYCSYILGPSLVWRFQEWVIPIISTLLCCLLKLQRPRILVFGTSLQQTLIQHELLKCIIEPGNIIRIVFKYNFLERPYPNFASQVVSHAITNSTH